MTTECPQTSFVGDFACNKKQFMYRSRSSVLPPRSSSGDRHAIELFRNVNVFNAPMIYTNTAWLTRTRSIRELRELREPVSLARKRLYLKKVFCFYFHAAYTKLEQLFGNTLSSFRLANIILRFRFITIVCVSFNLY